MGFTNVWDVTQPPDTQLANLLGQDIRSLKLDIQQRMGSISGILANLPNLLTEAQPANWTGLLYFAVDTGQIFQWNGAAWVDITFEYGLVLKGFSVNLIGQTAAISTTNIISSANAQGIYRVSAYMNMVTPGSGGGGAALNLVIGWGDSVGAKFQVVASLPVNVAGTWSSLTAPFFVALGQAISYAVTFVGITVHPTYNFYIRLEYMG